MSTATARHSQVVARCVCVLEFTISTLASARFVTRLEGDQPPIAPKTRKLLKSRNLRASQTCMDAARGQIAAFHSLWTMKSAFSSEVHPEDRKR